MGVERYSGSCIRVESECSSGDLGKVLRALRTWRDTFRVDQECSKWRGKQI